MTNPVFCRFPSRRSTVYGTKGVVSCSQPLAAEAGLEILRKGGNAADAAVAVSIALTVTEPSSCGIGGDAFCLFYDINTRSVKGLNGSGRSPKSLTIQKLRESGIYTNTIPPTSLHAVTVPGAAAAWVDTVSTFGSKNVTLQDVFNPGIRLAEEGIPVSEVLSYDWKQAENLLRDASPDGQSLLLNGKAPLAGQVVHQPDLAKTFRKVAEHGKNGFYRGPVASAIVDLITSKGGVMTLDDLASHESTIMDPISYTYGGDITLFECPPNGQGLTAIIALALLDTLEKSGKIRPLSQMEHNSDEYLHVLIECLRSHLDI